MQVRGKHGLIWNRLSFVPPNFHLRCLPLPDGYSHRGYSRVLLLPLEGLHSLDRRSHRNPVASNVAGWKEVHLGTRMETAKSHRRRSSPSLSLFSLSFSIDLLA